MNDPTWAILAAEKAGHGRGYDGVRRRAVTRICPTCHAHVSTGLDADMCALVATVDLAPLTIRGELAAALQGRPTYELGWTAAHGYRIERRSALRITWAPVGSPNLDGRTVHAEHRCHQPLPPHCHRDIDPAGHSTAKPQPHDDVPAY